MAELSYIECTVRIRDEEQTMYIDHYRRDAEDVLLDEELFRMTLDRLTAWVAGNERSGRSDLELLGRYLYRLIFHDKLKQAFETTYGLFEDELARNPQLRLRLVLVFEREVESLAAYPWEFIFMPRPDRGFFLAGEKTELILSRFVPESPAAGPLAPDVESLKILVACANPHELDVFDIDAFRQMMERLQSQHDNIMVEWEDQPRRKELSAKLASYAPHIFHFIGHGLEGQLALIRPEDEIVNEEVRTGKRREADLIKSDTFSDMVAEHKPRLVFLHACKGATTFRTTLSTFTSTARDLVYSRIPAVVGMQYEIENGDAATFAEVFYRELAGGKPIDEAVTAGRRELGRFSGQEAWGDRRFGTPIVYLQSPAPIIFTPPVSEDKEEETRADAERPDPVKTYPCPYGDGCRGQVALEWSRCVQCRRPTTTCPNGHVMAVGQACPFCDFDAGAGANAPTSAAPRRAPRLAEVGSTAGNDGLAGDGSFG